CLPGSRSTGSCPCHSFRPTGWLGAMVFALALALFVWAIATVTQAGSNVPTNLPTTTIVDAGPYRFTRNPIYLGMVLGLIGLSIALHRPFLFPTLVPLPPTPHFTLQ